MNFKAFCQINGAFFKEKNLNRLQKEILSLKMSKIIKYKKMSYIYFLSNFEVANLKNVLVEKYFLVKSFT